MKYKPDRTIQIYKARLVAKGFQKIHGIDYYETFTPIVKPSTIRVILNYGCLKRLDIKQIDINNAFQNDDLQEIVFMIQFKGFEDKEKLGYVCQLYKALYR